MKRKNVVVLGSTGSIGRSTAAVLRAHPERFRVAGIVARNSLRELAAQAAEFHPGLVVTTDSARLAELKALLLEEQPCAAGFEAVRELVTAPETDIVLCAIVGTGGLEPVIAALRAGKQVALASKEVLVMAGELVRRELDASPGGSIVPVDSEHSAIFQCLQDAESARSLTKILLTASGGPFFGMKAGQLKDKKKEDALRHPNWNMGAKITIDSATLMNKGLELIEAVWLFGLPPEKIQIVVQRQSIIHSAVQFSDHSILAQMGVPDMRIPIQYALTWPRRGGPAAPELDFAALKVLTFDVADEETFRCLAACKKAIAKGGLGPCAANGANEEAVKLFLEDKIGFLDIGRLVEAVVDSDRFGGSYTLADVYECDRMARAFVHAAL